MRECARSVVRARSLGRVAVVVAALGMVVVAAGCSEDTRDRIGEAVGERTDGAGGGSADAGGQGDGSASADGGGGGVSGDGAGQGDGGAGGEGAGQGDGGAGDGGAGGDGGQGGGNGGGIIPEDGNDLADSDFLLLALLGVAAVIAVLGVMHLGSTRQGRQAQARADDRARLASIVGGVRWITDQASMEVMRLTDPRQLAASWHATRARCMDVERQIATMVATESRPDRRADLDQVGRACAGLRMALEADVALRTDVVAPERPDLVTLSTQTVQQRRSELQFALVDLERAAR